jgi:hypothetical protein
MNEMLLDFDDLGDKIKCNVLLRLEFEAIMLLVFDDMCT